MVQDSSASLLIASAPTDAPPLKAALDGEPCARCDIGVPVLAGDEVDRFFTDARRVAPAGPLALFQKGDWLLGVGRVPAAADLELAARRLYVEIFHATRHLHLARIWNYVPAINQAGASGLENYRAFCQGRSLAFEQQHGAGFKFLVPAASAVGCASTTLTVVFVACHTRPRHVENPAQVPAYDYPREYGPRSPSFARATVVPGARDATVFISGTAAIRGHTTVAPDGIAGQLDCTLENLHEISRACGIGPHLAPAGASSRHFKVYVRHAADQPLVAATLGARLLEERDRVTYLHADICRRPLLVEIEATLAGVSIPTRLR
jgi:chorismate lyase / 3-hydroxybenzoate synthase